MSKYKVFKKSIPPREEKHLEKVYGEKNELLLSSPYNQVAPGLYPDETAVQIEGELVAVSVERHWPGNGEPLTFTGWARWVNEDGSTKLAPNNKPVESSMGHQTTLDELSKYGADALAHEVALLVMGEPPELTMKLPEYSVEEAEKKQLPPPKIIDWPVIGASTEVRMNASIREQIKAVKDSMKTSLKL